MKHVKKSVLLWYSPREMYTLVTAVEDYPSFLPWCERAEVLQRDDSGMTARLTLAKQPPALRLGTAISVSLTSPIAPRLRLPLSALQEVDGKTQVWVVDTASKTVNPKPVQVLVRSTDSVWLAGGIQAGERVVTAGVNSLKPGQNIKIDKEGPR